MVEWRQLSEQEQEQAWDPINWGNIAIAEAEGLLLLPNATDYHLAELHWARTERPEIFNKLDFSEFLDTIEELDELFPKLKDGGGLDPPPQYLSSGYKLV